MNEKEKIDFIRDNADQTIENGKESIFGQNKYNLPKKHENHTAKSVFRVFEKFAKKKMEEQ